MKKFDLKDGEFLRIVKESGVIEKCPVIKAIPDMMIYLDVYYKKLDGKIEIIKLLLSSDDTGTLRYKSIDKQEEDIVEITWGIMTLYEKGV